MTQNNRRLVMCDSDGGDLAALCGDIGAVGALVDGVVDKTVLDDQHGAAALKEHINEKCGPDIWGHDRKSLMRW